MPLKFNNVDSDLGIVLSDCYGVVSRYEGNMTNLRIWISIYTSKEAFETNKSVVSIECIDIVVSELAKTNIFAYIYNVMLYSPALSKFEPSIIELPFTMDPTLLDPDIAPIAVGETGPTQPVVDPEVDPEVDPVVDPVVD